MYGVAGENFNFRNMTHMFDKYAASGINHRSVHGIFYTLFGRGKRAYPPHISYYQPYWCKYKNITDYCARVSEYISDGVSETDIAIVHPLETGYMLYKGATPSQGSSSMDLTRLDNSLYDLLNALRSNRREVDFIDLASIRDMGSVENGNFRVGEMSYKTIIIPKLMVITKQMLSLLEEFSATGGKIIVYGRTPDMIDGFKDEAVAKKIDDISTKVNNLNDVLRMIPSTPYSIEGLGSENLLVNRRICKNGTRFFIANTDCAHEARITLTVKEKGNAYMYDAYSGNIYEYPCKKNENYTSTELCIPEGGSVLISFEHGESNISGKISCENEESIIKLGKTWEVTPLNENALLLEFCRFKKEDGNFSNKIPILAVQRILSDEDYRGKITLKYQFETTEYIKNTSLALESPELQSITLDGKTINTEVTGYFFEKAFKKITLGDLTKGIHTLEITREFYPLTKVTNDLTQLFETRYGIELEPIYLLGNFKVNGLHLRCDNGSMLYEPDFVISNTAETEYACGDLTSSGYPFYVGSLSLSQNIFIDKSDLSDAKLRVEVMNAGCGEIWINGKYAGDINRAPFDISIGSLLNKGDNKIEIKLYTTLYNIIGPFHRVQGNVGNTFGGGYKNPDAAWLSIDTDAKDWDKRMNDFSTTWTDRYNVSPLGVKRVSIVF
jgi:hypothetical protein